MAGATLGDLAGAVGAELPRDLRRAKGLVGQLLEAYLGASAGSRALPDFPELAIELKSLPLDRSGKPLESTFVCSIPIADMAAVEWTSSRVRRKLSRVLWVPVEAEPALALAQRRFGQALLWSPSPEEEQALAEDWLELAGYIGRGQVEALTGHRGRFLQVRPKAAHGRARRLAFDADGAPIAAMPRGFYLRPSFTRAIIERHYALPR
jgi:DNA mismatch repair protein MutH